MKEDVDVVLTKTNHQDGSVSFTMTETRTVECSWVRSRCPLCGHPDYKEIQEHGHYRTECCKQITTGCCNGEQG